MPAANALPAEAAHGVELRSAKGSTKLEDEIRSVVSHARKAGRGGWGSARLAADERTAWLVYDLKAGGKLAGIDDDVPMQCASMVKPFCALAYLHLVSAGRLSYDAVAKRQLTASLRKSSNPATNWMIDQVGGPAAVQRLLHIHYPSIFKQTRIVEKIPPGGATYRNVASAQDYCRFAIALHRGKLPNSRELKRIMGLPKKNRLYTGVSSIPTGTVVQDKTGTTARLVGDFGIISEKWRVAGGTPT